MTSTVERTPAQSATASADPASADPALADPASAPSFERLATAIDDAVAAAANLEPTARKVVDSLREALETAHGEALRTIVRRLRTDEAGRTALYELVDDPLVRMLFLLHGIIRPDPATEARAALEGVRPGLQSHGGDVELVRIEDGTAYVRLSGACNGCSMSAVTMRNTVEKALIGAVAAVSAVEVVPSEPSPAVIPLSALRRREETPEELREAGWVSAVASADVKDGTVVSLRLTSPGLRAEDVVIVRIGSSLSAYKDECAHQALPLGDAMIDITAGTLTCPWHGFCYDALSGECMSAPGAALEQVPLRVEDGQVWIRIGT